MAAPTSTLPTSSAAKQTRSILKTTSADLMDGSTVAGVSFNVISDAVDVNGKDIVTKVMTREVGERGNAGKPAPVKSITVPSVQRKPSLVRQKSNISFSGAFSGPHTLFEEGSGTTALNAYLKTFTLPGSDDVEDGENRTKLGVLLGVYLPTIQHIFGVIMFLRLPWIVGTAGIVYATVMVSVCCLCTFLTSVSMSAIATNGVVESGGAYFMISRNLGAEFGSSVGILFYMANTVATSMYLVGGTEILLSYIAPQLDLNLGYTNHLRIYASIMLFIELIIVLLGVRFVQLFAPISLACVILSILSVYVGGFTAHVREMPEVCMLNDRLLRWDAWNVVENNFTNEKCFKAGVGPIFESYCPMVNETNKCPKYFTNKTSQVIKLSAFPGAGSSVLRENLWPTYLKKHEVVPGEKAITGFEVEQDMRTTFFILLAIYFPSVTGIMTGSNMSGDLKDPQKSIPIGTILAQLTTSFVYLSFIWLFGGTVKGAVLRDKLGDSLNGHMVVAILSWPHEWVLLIGSFTSTFGAALQCLCSAPRLLQAIAKDDVIPILRPFTPLDRRHEPVRATILTALIAWLFCLIGSIDVVAPIVDFFFLMCYGFVNFACALQTVMRAPNWRPRFRLYHWTLSCIGFLLCIFIMFATHWEYALIVLGLCFSIFKYVEYKGAKKEWGDGIRGLALSTAQYSLLQLQEEDTHPKNWRPQLLVLMKPIEEKDQIKFDRMLGVASQLKAGQGLTMVHSLMRGHYSSSDDQAKAKQIERELREAMSEQKVKGFANVLIARDFSESILTLLQAAGIGGMRPNTVMLGFPSHWSRYADAFRAHRDSGQSLDDNLEQYFTFLDTLYRLTTTNMCLLIPKGVEHFPDATERLTGDIDVWWIMHDGGLLLLIPFLLKRHKVWHKCRLRIFTVAGPHDNSIKMRNDLRNWCYMLRIDAEVDVVEMTSEVISAYAYERTLRMEERSKFLEQLHLSQREEHQEPQLVIERARTDSVAGFKPGEAETLKSKLSRAASIGSRHRKMTPPVLAKKSVQPDPGRFSSDPLLEVRTSGSSIDEDSKKSSVDHTKLGNTLGAHLNVQADHLNVKRMNTALDLNRAIRSRSSSAQLVVLNLPLPPKTSAGFIHYLEYLEALTESMDRVLLVRGSGMEVITMYS